MYNTCVTILCQTCKMYLILYSFVMVCFTNIFANATYFQDSAVIVNFTTCTNNDIQDQSGCNLTCTVSLTQYADIQWTYHYSDSEMKVILRKSHSKSGLKSNFFYIDVNNYHAGFYSFEVLSHENSTVIAHNTFKINTNSTVAKGIKESCNLDIDCIALNSKCTNETCQCQQQFPIPSSKNKAATTCLAKKNYGEPCQLDEQCESINPLYYCKHERCRCKEFMKYIEKLKTRLCIMQAFHGNSCTYDEECQLSDKNMKCGSLEECFCDEQFVYIQEEGCVLSTQFYFNSMRVGIISIIIFILAIAIVLIFAHMQRKALRESDQTRQQQILVRYLFGNRQTQRNGSTGIPEAQFPPSYDEVQNAETPPPTYTEYTFSPFNFEIRQNVTFSITKEDSSSNNAYLLPCDNVTHCTHM